MFFRFGGCGVFGRYIIPKVVAVRYCTSELLGLQDIHCGEDHVLDTGVWAYNWLYFLCGRNEFVGKLSIWAFCT